MRKESDEDDEFYDRTLKIPEKSQAEKDKLKQEAAGKNFGEMKRKLEGLLAEKTEINENLANLAKGERAAKTAALTAEHDEDLDRLLRDDEAAARNEQRASAIGRLKEIVAEIDQ